MIRYLLDTNICIELIRGRSEPVLAHLRRCDVGEVGICTITLSEFEYGIARSRDPARNRIALAHFAAPLEMLPFDHHAAAQYGPLRAQLEQAGTPIGPLDTLIAAHALALDVTLVTNNEREFQRIEHLKHEDWTRAT